MRENKEILLSGCRPTGGLHLGHYLGTFKKVAEYQENFKTFFVISNYHMLTTKNTKDDINNMFPNIFSILAECIALGINPKDTTFYLQSEVLDLPKLYVFIQNYAYVSNLMNNEANKEMNYAANKNESFGLLGYSVLEVADMIGVGAKKVIIGKDNVNHLNVTKSIFDQLNEIGAKIVKPEPIVTLDNNLPGLDIINKMSKSLNNSINLSDSSDEISFKLNSVLKSNKEILLVSYKESLSSFFDISNILDYSDLIEFIIEILAPITEKRIRLLKEKDYLTDILISGSEKINEIFSKNVDNLFNNVNFFSKIESYLR